jgi:hypothetical protein
MNQPEVKTRSDKSVQQEFRIAECELRNWGHAECGLRKEQEKFRIAECELRNWGHAECGLRKELQHPNTPIPQPLVGLREKTSLKHVLGSHQIKLDIFWAMG